MKIAIVGAGISGIAAARTLQQAGAQAILFDKSRAVGGRIATRRLEGFTFDTGAQNFAPGDRELGRLMTGQLDQTNLVQVPKPIYTHSSLHVSRGDPHKNARARYTYKSGNTQLPKLLAEGLDIRFDCGIDEVSFSDDRYQIRDESFDGVILTVPIPQASLLLWGLEERRAVAGSRYRSCLSVLLGFNLPPPSTAYYALVNTEGGHPLEWLAIENYKCEDRAPAGSTAIIAQLSAGYSQAAWQHPDEKIVETVCSYLSRLYGPAWTRPIVSDVKKWKYSQPESIVSFAIANPLGSRLLLAGDGLLGGRAELAFETGVMAAQQLLTTS